MHEVVFEILGNGRYVSRFETLSAVDLLHIAQNVAKQEGGEIHDVNLRFVEVE